LFEFRLFQGLINKAKRAGQIKYWPSRRKNDKLNPMGEKPEGRKPMKEKVQEALNKVRPQLQADGGDVELVEVTEGGLVQVRLTGACKGCPMSQMTLKMGIEKFLKQQVPEVTVVESV
jgi:Fe-S cluster biogenesis protein NfuA